MPLWVILFIVFFGLLILRVPVAFALGTSSMICLWQMNVNLSIIGQKLFTSVDQFLLMAVPFFILSGNIMCQGKLSKRLTGFCSALLAGIRGGLAAATVLSCGIFGALSGSGPATCIAIGSMCYPEMVERGYDKEEAAGIICAGGALGPIIPPSIVMVVYGFQTNTSISDMFIAGAGIGVMIMIVLMIYIIIRAIKNNWDSDSKTMSAGAVFSSFKSAILALGMPIIILGGIYGGIFTPTEAACVSVVYATVVSVFIYKTLKWRDFPAIIMESATGTAGVLFVVACSSVFAWLFSYSGMTNQIIGAIVSANLSKVAFLLVLSVILLIFGCFMDATPIIILLMPIVLPMAAQYGIDPLHLAMVVCVGCTLGMLTPPVAINIYACTTFSKLSMEQITKGELRYFLIMVVLYFLIVLFEPISKFLL